MEKFSKDIVAQSSRIPEFDFIRVLAMFWVVTYHYGCEYSLPFAAGPAPMLNFFCITPNFDFGNVAVTLFLVLSGALLYRKYGAGNGDRLTVFYGKRVKAIYPPFWILNLYILLPMVRHWMSDGTPFFAGNPLKLLLTVVGFDGYLSLFGIKSYYFCGEWFVGAIVFLYLLFPLLAVAYKNFKIAFPVILAACYGLQFLLPSDWVWALSAFPFTLLFKFVLGFVLMDFLPRLRHPAFGWGSFLLFLALCLVELPLETVRFDLPGLVAGVLVFICVVSLGHRLKESSGIWILVKKLSPMTYCVFLVQHIAIVWFQMALAKVFGTPVETLSPAMYLGIFVLTFAVILGMASLLKFVSDWAVKRVERKFLS